MNVWEACAYSFILAGMHASAQPVLAILLALALIVGGVGRFALCCGEEGLTSHSHGGGAHAGHHHSPDHDAAKKPLSAPGCLKSCGICVADPGLSRAPTVTVELTRHAAVFSIDTKTYHNRPVVIDPGIPKSLA